MISDLILELLSARGFGSIGTTLLAENIPEDVSEFPSIVALYNVFSPPPTKNKQQESYFSLIIRSLDQPTSADIAYRIFKLFNDSSFVASDQRLVCPRISPPTPLGFDEYSRFKYSLNITIYSKMD